ncbi:1-acyl-sn-glycerol-3-phosphate acyltransferase [hydrothermal vent metagenome]|uniref:1-acyl-sn-glycerol-3-phosphate acyltransferase n=1 Tax=hydrothermal vent metagenome TaxID=652676 RepID=A0A1W1C4K6_9ZZZZ
MKIFAKIRFYWGAFAISFVVAVIMIPLITIFPKYQGSIMHHLNRFIIFIMGGKLEEVGELDKDADMLVANHQGIMDVVGLEAVQNNNLRWIAKKELFDAFWFGYVLKNSNMISVDRENKAGLVKLLKDVKESRDTLNRQVVLFPEGTRAKGQELLSFKSGTKFIANKLKLKVQPIVITGSKQLLNEHIRTGHNATVKFIYLPTIDLNEASDDWYEKMRNDMQKVIDDEYTHNHRSR